MSELKGRVWRDSRTGAVWTVAVHPSDAQPVVAFCGSGGLVMCTSPIEGNEWGLADLELAELLDKARGEPPTESES